MLYLKCLTFFAEDFKITKAEMKQLNRHDAPCEEDNDQMNHDLCIKRSIEQILNCTIPDVSFGEAVPPVGKLKYDICSTNEQFAKLAKLRKLQEFGCLATCQGKLTLK